MGYTKRILAAKPRLRTFLIVHICRTQIVDRDLDFSRSCESGAQLPACSARGSGAGAGAHTEEVLRNGGSPSAGGPAAGYRSSTAIVSEYEVSWWS